MLEIGAGTEGEEEAERQAVNGSWERRKQSVGSFLGSSLTSPPGSNEKVTTLVKGPRREEVQGGGGRGRNWRGMIECMRAEEEPGKRRDCTYEKREELV